jgi:RNA polymerase sigma-70 factor (ECF subfamily)
MSWRSPPEPAWAYATSSRGDDAARRWPRLDTLLTRPNAGSRAKVSTEPTRETVERARQGDPDAFEALFRASSEDVLRVCRRMLGDADGAADARSDVFLKVRRSLASYDPRRPFGSWIRSVASHHCIDLLRRRALEQRLFAELDQPVGELEGPSPSPSPLSRVLARERRDALEEGLGALPLEYRLPLLMRYFGDASYDEIAESLGTTRARVGTLIFRAKKKLRARMGSDAAGEEGTR